MSNRSHCSFQLPVDEFYSCAIKNVVTSASQQPASEADMDLSLMSQYLVKIQNFQYALGICKWLAKQLPKGKTKFNLLYTAIYSQKIWWGFKFPLIFPYYTLCVYTYDDTVPPNLNPPIFCVSGPTAKFKDRQYFYFGVSGPTAKFKDQQYFRLYGIQKYWWS